MGNNKYQTLKQMIKKFCPLWVFPLLAKIRRLFVHIEYDSSDYWRGRATGIGQARVLWTNEEYNLLFRHLEREIITDFFRNMKRVAHALDIGCGIGVVSAMMVELDPHIVVDAVDFSEMINVARRENPSNRIIYIESSAEEFFQPDEKYDFIISSACFSAIRDINKLEQAVVNCIRMLKSGGTMLMIDPLHAWNYLARAKYSSDQMTTLASRHGLQLVWKSGLLFWPYREWLANSSHDGNKLKQRFYNGESLLRILGEHTWADYKVLAFRKV